MLEKVDVRYELNGMGFVWDEDKARANVLSHGVSFEQACPVFFDPFLRIEKADRHEEERYAAIGYDDRERLLHVVNIEFDGKVIRLISARKATATERERYDS